MSGNIVHNCGFETGDTTGWTITGQNAQGIEPAGAAAGAPNSGSYYDEDGTVGAPDDLSQTLTDAQPGTPYALTFYAMDTYVGRPNESFAVTVDNVETAPDTVGTATLFTDDGDGSQITGSYQPFTVYFTVPTTAESTVAPVLHFRIQNTPFAAPPTERPTTTSGT